MRHNLEYRTTRLSIVSPSAGLCVFPTIGNATCHSVEVPPASLSVHQTPLRCLHVHSSQHPARHPGVTSFPPRPPGALRSRLPTPSATCPERVEAAGCASSERNKTFGWVKWKQRLYLFGCFFFLSRLREVLAEQKWVYRTPTAEFQVNKSTPIHRPSLVRLSSRPSFAPRTTWSGRPTMSRGRTRHVGEDTADPHTNGAAPERCVDELELARNVVRRRSAGQMEGVSAVCPLCRS